MKNEKKDAARGNYLSRISIFKKLMLSSVGVLICACFCVSLYLTWNTRNLLVENSMQQARQELTSIVNGFATTLSNQYAALEELAGYEPLLTYLDSEFPSPYSKYLHFSNSVEPWVQWLRRSTDPMSLRIYMDEDYQSISSITGGRLALLDGRLSHTQSESVHTALTYTVVNGKYSNALMYYRGVWNTAHTKLRRVVTVVQSCDDLRRNILTEENTLYYLINPSGQVVSSNDAGASGQIMASVLMERGIQERNLPTESVVSIQGTEYYVLRENLNLGKAGLGRGWWILYLRDYEEIDQDIRRQIFISAAICLTIVGFALTLAFVVSYNINSRLRLVMKKIDSLSRGEFDNRVPVSGKDEIAQIGDSFDQMSAHIFQLIEDNHRAYQEVIESERKQKELLLNWKNAEYQVLRAQINPHYLFNTLETIRMNLLLNGQQESARILRLFADTIREYMDVKSMYSPLGEELRFIGYYMAIQKFRMGDRLLYEVDVPEALMDIEIPRLILQPVVENAIDHGIDRKVEGGTVRLKARREGEWLEIVVTDDGVGMSADQLAKLRRRLNADQGEHLGVWNIRRRLKLLYGEEGGVTVESTEGVGSVVTMRFSVMKPKEGEDKDV